MGCCSVASLSLVGKRWLPRDGLTLTGAPHLLASSSSGLTSRNGCRKTPTTAPSASPMPTGPLRKTPSAVALPHGDRPHFTVFKK